MKVKWIGRCGDESRQKMKSLTTLLSLSPLDDVKNTFIIRSLSIYFLLYLLSFREQLTKNPDVIATFTSQGKIAFIWIRLYHV